MNNLKIILTLFITLNSISFSSISDEYVFAISSYPVAYDTQTVSERHIPYVDFLNDLAFNAKVDIDASINTNNSIYGKTVEIISAWSLPVKKSFIRSFNSGVDFGKNSPYQTSIFHKDLMLSVTDKLGPYLNKNRHDNFDATRENYALFICFKVGGKVIKKPITTNNGNIRSVVNGEKDKISIPLFVKVSPTFDYWFEVGLLHRKGDDQFTRVESL
ncbi:MAG: hypothetical protein ACI936_001365 [Paraglaciecola sp.]|jgi:hypothetical protein